MPLPPANPLGYGTNVTNGNAVSSKTLHKSQTPCLKEP